MTVSLTTLVSFNDTDGNRAFGSLIIDANGDLFGTTEGGGPEDDGTVFEIPKTAAGYASTPSTLVNFGDHFEGYGPHGGLIADASGNLFGTTQFGHGTSEFGTVFEITKTTSGYASTPTTLVNFNGTNGFDPLDSLIADANGDLFGTTEGGGANGDGTVFEITKTASGYASTPVNLLSFNGTDGANPTGSLIADASGNLFGTTTGGGANGDGTVFEITKTASGFAGAPITLLNFNGTNGSDPFAGLVADANGNLFGTARGGGANGDGTVFEIPKTASGYGTFITLLSFNGADGANPTGSLIADASGNLFGTTTGGGANGDGTVFEITKTASGYASTPTTLVNFNGTNGSDPSASLVADANGDLFGTAAFGGANGDGTVFEITGSSFVTLAINGTSVTGTEGSSTGTTTVATFTDANPNALASDFTATINWGDGTNTTGTVVAQNGSAFAVDGAHTYADEGKYTVDVSITDVGGSTASATSNANIADAAIIAQSPGLILGNSFRVPNPHTITVATFTDANPNATASDFTATINWGDGTSTSGTVVAQNGGGFAVEGGHVYAADSRLQLGQPVPLFEIDVAIHDIGGSNARASSTATVIPAVTVAEAIGNYQSDPNIAPQVVVDSQANVAGNLNALETLAAVNDIVSITLTESALDPISQDYPIIIAGFDAVPEIITTKLLEALFNGGAAVVVGDGAPTYHRADAGIDNSGVWRTHRSRQRVQALLERRASRLAP